MKDIKQKSAAFAREIQKELEDIPESGRKEQAVSLLAAYEKNIEKLLRLQKSLHRKQEGSNAQKMTIQKIADSKRKKEVHEKELRSILRNSWLYG